jgi:hypothetical protein
MSVPTMTQTKAPTSLSSRRRVALVTLGVIVVATVLPTYLEVALTVLINAIAPNLTLTALGQVSAALTPATESVAPAALGGIFWLALLRLPRHGPARVWLETLGLGALFFSLTLVLVGVATYYADVLIIPALAQVSGGPLQVVGAVAAVPWAALVLAALALLYSGIGFGGGLLLARWSEARKTLALPAMGGRHFALVYGVASLIMLVLAALTPLFLTLAVSPALTGGTRTPAAAANVFLFTWQFILPSAITAITGAVGALRALREPQGPTVTQTA